jgi:DNA-binding transcriptional LysR family regulator
VLPAFFVDSTGYRGQVVTRPLPFELAGLHVAMLWHQRHDRSSSHQWLRARLLEAAASQAG